MSDYLTKNRLILAKVESTPGTDASPVPATDDVLVENPQWTPGIGNAETGEVTGSLDPRSPVFTGGGASWSGTVNLKGAGTAGAAPEAGVLLRGCGFSQTLTAAAITGTAQAGAAGTITLAADDAGATNAYVGMVISTTGGTGPGQSRVITALNATSKVASVYPNWTVNPSSDTTYSIHANALYVPASTDLKRLSIYDYQHATTSGVDSRLRKVLGAAGTVSFTMPNRGVPQANFQFQGKFVAPADVSKPTGASFDTTRPVAILGVDYSLGGVATKFNQVTMDIGGQVSQADDPSATYGVDVAGLTARRITGRVNPPLTLASTRDVFAALVAGTQYKQWLRWGSTSGNRISMYWPTIQFTNGEAEDVNGFAHEGIPWSAQGEDSGVYICFY